MIVKGLMYGDILHQTHVLCEYLQRDDPMGGRTRMGRYADT